MREKLYITFHSEDEIRQFVDTCNEFDDAIDIRIQKTAMDAKSLLGMLLMKTEEPLEIIAAIEKGLKKTPCPYTVIEDRREAIAYALHIARKDDVVLLAGKGHETYQNIKGVRHAFDEKKIVYELLAP